MKRIDLTGKRFGRLLVIAPDEKRDCNGNWFWLCKCDCGNTAVVHGHKLGRKTNSCGCLRRENTRAMKTKHGAMAGVHNGSAKPGKLYQLWKGMKQRCLNPKCPCYHRYGGRGITICERWLDFAAFRDDMIPTYKPGLTLDRINNDGPYEPANCRWATQLQQSRNKRTNMRITHNGRTMTLSEWAAETGIGWGTIRQRILVRKWPTSLALSKIPNHPNGIRK